MTINGLKELEQLMKLCRKQGILTIKIDNIEFRLDDSAAPRKREVKMPAIQTHTPGGITEETKIDMPDALTEEQLLYYSAGAPSEQVNS